MENIKIPNKYVMVLDLEVDVGGNRKDPTPYNKDNSFVALGYTLRNLNGSRINASDTVVIVNTY